MSTNDNEPAGESAKSFPYDEHGGAALLLIESLIHGLCENGTLSTAQAIDVVERATSVQSDYAEDADNARSSSWRSHALLSSIVNSLKVGAD